MEEKKEEVKEQEATEVNTEEAKPEEQEQEEVYTKAQLGERLKKMQSDSEKGVQKLIAESKFKDSVFEAVGQVSADNAALIAIHEKNPKVAQEILKRFYEGKTIEEYKEAIGYKENLADPETYRRKLELEKNRAIADLKVEQAKEAFIKELEISDDERKAFEEAFEERKGMKTFSVESVQTHLEKAYREIDKTDIKSLRQKEAIGKSMATSEGKGGGSASKKETPLERAVREATEYKKKFGLQ